MEQNDGIVSQYELHTNVFVFCECRKNIRLFFTPDNSTEDSIHPVILHLIEAFRASVKKENPRYIHKIEYLF